MSEHGIEIRSELLQRGLLGDKQPNEGQRKGVFPSSTSRMAIPLVNRLNEQRFTANGSSGKANKSKGVHLEGS